MYKVQIEVFEGPMELLLHLVEKNQLDIYTVSIAAITDQFIAYVENTSNMDLENIGEFMVMASLLMRIKIKQLLPVSALTAADDEEIINEEQALVERLIEYRMFKEVAAYLDDRAEGRVARVYYHDGEVMEAAEAARDWSANLEQLIKAFLSLEKSMVQPPIWNLIPQGDVDVEGMMTWLWDRLANECEFIYLWQCFPSRRERVALFLALLELIHIGQVEAYQDLVSGKLVISRKEVARC